MNFDTALIAFGIASLTIGVTLLTIYTHLDQVQMH